MGSGFVILSVHYSGFGVCYTGVCIIVGSVVVRYYCNRKKPKAGTEDCKLVVTCKMQKRNAIVKLNQQCSKLALLSYHKFQ